MLRSFLAICAAALAFPAMVLGDSAATRPALKAAVAPFDVVGEAGHEWLGRAMQEGLAMGLQKNRGISAVIVPGLAPADANAAIAAADSANADVVVLGSIQVLDDQIRVGGQIISVKTGQVIGGLQSDGNVRGLFDIEDLLSDRAGRLLRPVNHAAAASAVRRPTLEIVGPTVATQSAQYFDGDISSVISRPQRFGDEYDRYYYQSASTAGCGYGCCFGALSYWGFGCGAGPVFQSAYPVHGW
jgi:TolB-like protein